MPLHAGHRNQQQRNDIQEGHRAAHGHCTADEAPAPASYLSAKLSPRNVHDKVM